MQQFLVKLHAEEHIVFRETRDQRSLSFQSREYFTLLVRIALPRIEIPTLAVLAT